MGEWRAEGSSLDFDLQFFYSEDGKSWKPYPNSIEVSGYHHNVLSSFSSLKLGVLVKGQGAVTIDDFTYKSLD